MANLVAICWGSIRDVSLTALGRDPCCLQRGAPTNMAGRQEPHGPPDGAGWLVGPIAGPVWLGFQKHNLHTPTLSSPERSWQMMLHGLKAEVLTLKHRPIHQYLEMRQECRTFKIVISNPCDWLLLGLAMRTRGTPFSKIDGNRKVVRPCFKRYLTCH